jgi:DltD protein
MWLRFISKLAVFLSPLALLLCVTENRLASVNSGYRTKREYLERSIERTQVLVLGSSHAYYGVKARMLGAPAFNAAYVAQDVYYDSRIVLKYLPRARNLRLVIVTVSYFTFETRLEDYSEGWRASYYYRYWGIPRADGGFKIEDYSLVALYGIPQTRAFWLNGFAAESRDQMDEDGSKADFLGPDPAVEAGGRISAKLQDDISNPKYVADNVRYLEEMLDALKAKGVDVVFVTTPGVRSYYEALRPDLYGVMQEKVQYLCQKYGLSYYNYLKDPRFTDDDFTDSNHLNTQGAEKLSRILRDEVVSTRLRSGGG